MGHHLTDGGDFKSDLYAWCPKGFFALDFTRPKARIAIKLYAALTSEPAEAIEAHLDARPRNDWPGTPSHDWTSGFDEGIKAAATVAFALCTTRKADCHCPACRIRKNLTAAIGKDAPNRASWLRRGVWT